VKNVLKILVLLTAFWSCKTEDKQATVNIDGSFEAYPNHWVYLEELDVRQSVRLDSVRTDGSGSFNLKIDISEPGFFVIKTSEENYMILLLTPDEEVRLSSENEIFASGYEVAGSQGSEWLRDFEMFSHRHKMEVDSLAEVFYAHRGEPDFLEVKTELDSLYLEIFSEQREYVLDFIEKHPGSLASLILINRKLGQNRLLDEEGDYKYFYWVDSALVENHPNNKHTLDHHNRFLEIKGRLFEKQLADEKLRPGNKAPEIVVKDTADEFVSLRTIPEQRVLICFWAGWNAKSRQDNRILLDQYSKLKSNNIEVFGVSFDEHEMVWKGAVKLDGLPWVNGSDLLGLGSPLLKEYNLVEEELPFYYLVDKDRRIIYRSGELTNILNQLEELF
jgi:peroxiredoxin